MRSTLITTFRKMLSKCKRPMLVILILLFSVQVFQILYRNHVLEITQTYERLDESKKDEIDLNSDIVNVGNEVLGPDHLNERYIKDGSAISSSTSTSTSTTSSTTSSSTSPSTSSAIAASENDENKRRKSESNANAVSPKEGDLVTNEVQAKIADFIRQWKASPDGAEKLDNHFKYDGRDLLKDPVFKFNPSFKNPCWFENKKLHCLPYVYVIGVKKCGTSDLFYRMSLHPDFVRPGFKEAQWFARKRFRSGGIYDDIYEYVSMFTKAAATIQNKSKTSQDGQMYNYQHITGEGSPSNLHLNMHWKHLPGNENLKEPKYVILDYIHHFIPKAKIIITFRDPVERLYSDYYHEYGTLMKGNKPNPRQFHMVVSEGVKLYQDCFRRRSVRSCCYEPSLYYQTKIQIQLGIYYIFWEDLTRLYPRDQILVLQNKNLRDKENSMKTVFQFLNLRPLAKDDMTRVVNAEERYQRSNKNSKKGPMLNETLDILYEFYRPFNRIMAKLTDDKSFLYTRE